MLRSYTIRTVVIHFLCENVVVIVIITSVLRLYVVYIHFADLHPLCFCMCLCVCVDFDVGHTEHRNTSVLWIYKFMITTGKQNIVHSSQSLSSATCILLLIHTVGMWGELKMYSIYIRRTCCAESKHSQWQHTKYM